MGKSTAERQSAYRDKRKADGWKQKLIWFSPEAQQVLDSIPEGQTLEQFLNDLVVAQKNLTKPN